jgi:hypothetical protein
MFNFDFRPELDSIGERVPHHEHKAMKISLGRQVLHFVEVDFHVSRQGWNAFA